MVNKINYIQIETDYLYDKLTELYEAMVDDDSTINQIIDDIRDKLLTIKKDLTNEI